MIKTKWGGFRERSGRKPLDETKRKKGVTIYIKQSTIKQIEDLGIGDNFSRKAEEIIVTEIKKRKKELK